MLYEKLKNKKDDVIISSNDYYLIQNQVINIVGDITMTYKIIGDSCLDLPKELRNAPHFQMIPLTLQVGSASVVDDETFDQKQFLELVTACPECPKTASGLRSALKKLMNAMQIRVTCHYIIRAFKRHI